MSDLGYTETILFDCIRLSSIEYSASKLSQTNNALFTNKVSNGIVLNVGDQVSIQSAHIAQRGAGGDVIEFRGEDIGEKTINYTKTVNSSYIGYADLDKQGRYSPTGYAYETSSNVDEQVKISDNKASIVVEYYKNTNGENYITLPRNYGNASQGNASVPNWPSSSNVPAGTNSGSFWTQRDGYPLGANTFCPLKSHIFTDDYNFLDSEQGQSGLNICGTGARILKLVNDNSRYTMFKKKEVVWNSSQVSSGSLSSWLKGGHETAPDPATHDYVRYKQKVDISVPAGYNSPSNIASTITDELSKTDDPINILQKVGERLSSTIVNSEINKAFPCANYSLFGASGNIDFFNASLLNKMPVSVSNTSVQSALAADYLTNYTYVGFKRPDYIEKGREAFAYHGSNINEKMNVTGHVTATMKTTISWSDSALSGIKAFFDTQKDLYPELLDGGTLEGRTDYDGYNTTSASLNASFREEARFLHLDVGTYTKAGADPLGSDMYNVSYSTNTGLPPPAANVSDITSIPLFCYFNKNSSHLTTEDTIGDRNDNLAYGFGRRYLHTDGFYYLELTFELIGGIPELYYQTSSAGSYFIWNGTKIGYDYHFGAYGNAAILPSSGFHIAQYYGLQQYLNAPKIRHVYMGANNPLFNFDNVENRFEISNLHTAEKVGNFFSAGDPLISATVYAPPVSGQGSEDCYKIHKQMDYLSWSPSMMPYSEIVSRGNGSSVPQTSFIGMNENLDFRVPYDSHSGVAITDMGVSETLWNESIWGILGWEYSQFNTSGSDIKNNNARMTNIITNVSGVTTNANIISTDSLNYLMNAYATNMYLPMINSDLDANQHPFTIGDTAIPSGSFSTVQPPSTIIATSTLLKAANLPRKILRGYFTLSSDILDQTGYLQTANPMSVMAVAGKYSGENDFVEYTGGGAIFTVTRKKVITDITTQILDPEGRLAQVGDNSGVIYRLDRRVNTDLHFAEHVLDGTIK